jgi:xanthine dehydrogenase accessory factor
MHLTDTIATMIETLKADGKSFAIATVVRTVSLTAAKAGAKAVIDANGVICSGWIGGGCARGAVRRAAIAAIADGKPRLISVQPPDLLDAQGIAPNEEREGLQFAKNMCPSQGTMDVFIEPVLPRPRLLVCGAAAVAVALADLARHFGYAVTVAAPLADQHNFPAADERLTEYDFTALTPADRYIVVATQGNGDEAALRAALSIDASYVGFVGSRRKMAALRQTLAATPIDPARFAALHAPAGLAIDAVTPEEIALSILAEITATRRQKQRVGQGVVTQ